ncbi:unnamed protein product [Prunus brigantina]
MFQFTLDPCALLLRQAVTPFIQAEAYNGEIYVSPTVVTLIAEASGSVVLVLRMKPCTFNSFTCTKNLSLGLDLASCTVISFEPRLMHFSVSLAMKPVVTLILGSSIPELCKAIELTFHCFQGQMRCCLYLISNINFK